jgi:hypothetical protein
MLYLAQKNLRLPGCRNGGNKMKKRLRKIKPAVLLTHVLITLGYPVMRGITAESGKLLAFTDALTIFGCVLLIAGVVYALYLRGDFDISSFEVRRGVKKGSKSFDAYMSDRKERRDAAFNYPLFLGGMYVLISIILAYAFL